MAMIDINRNPSPRELRWFGAIILAFFAILGAVLLWQLRAIAAARVVWGIGIGLAAVFYAARPMRLPLYLAWMHAVAPLGWVISHLALAIVYFAVISPIATVTRVFRRDKLERRFDESADSYWTPHDPGDDMGRYFRQT